MGFIKPTFLVKGALKEGVNIFEEAEQIGKEGVSILKEAKEEVQEEINTVSNNYDKAIALADSAGGGAFGKYLFNYYGNIEQLASLADLAPEDRTKQLSLIKSEYNNLPDETKAKLSDGDFSEMVDKRYNLDVDRIKSGLVNENNMGEATANTLIGRVQSMVDKRFEPQREQIMSTVGGRDLRESDPVEGGFESIASGQQGPIDYLMAGSLGADIQKIKMEAEDGFEKFLTSNRFKQEGTNMFFERGALEFIGNIIFPDGISPTTNSVQDVRDTLETISRGLENVSPALVAESILKDYYLEQTYQGFFDYTSFYDMYELNEATKAYEASKNQTEQS